MKTLNRIKDWFIAIYNIIKTERENSKKIRIEILNLFDSIAELRESKEKDVSDIHNRISESNFECRKFVLDIENKTANNIAKIDTNLNKQINRVEGEVVKRQEDDNNLALRNLCDIIKPAKKGTINAQNVKYNGREYKSIVKEKEGYLVEYIDNYTLLSSKKPLQVEGNITIN